MIIEDSCFNFCVGFGFRNDLELDFMLGTGLCLLKFELTIHIAFSILFNLPKSKKNLFNNPISILLQRANYPSR